MGRVITALAGTPLLLLSAALSATAAGPDEVIRQASDEIVAVLAERREELEQDTDELYRVVDEILLPRFDLRYSGGLVMGKFWRRANDEQRERFTMALYRSLVRTYADNILSYRGDQLEVLPVAEIDEEKGRALVETRVTLETGVVTPVNYRMRVSGGDWKAYDVVIEGISYVTNYRKQYSEEFRAKGIDQVIAELEAKAALPVADGAPE